MNANTSDFKQAAKASLSTNSHSAKKLVLIHFGITVALSLIIYALDWLLEHQISQSSGLGGIGARSVLSTVQVVLRLAQTALLPFWQIGYLFATLKLSRKKSVSPMDLTEGFSLFGPVLRLNLFRTLLFSALAVGSSYLASTLFLMSPLSRPMMEQLLSNDQLLEDPEAMMTVIEQTSTPLLLIFAAVYLIVFIPVFYRYRLDGYLLLDDPKKGALSAMRTSRRQMRGNCALLFRLDLSWWWFYLLDALAVLVCYLDVILEFFGVALPISTQLASFLCLAVSLLGQLGLYVWKRNEVAISYAHAYDWIAAPSDTEPEATL